MTTDELLQELIEQQSSKQTQPAFILLPPSGQPCKWTSLSRRDINALILATQENNRGHGLQRTNKDKRRCAEIALREFPQPSDAGIAKICGVSDRFVNGVRGHSGGNGSDLTRTGRDGKEYRVRHRSPTAVLADNLPNFKLPADPMAHPQALSTYFTGLAEQICVPICKYPALANPINAAMYAMFIEVLKRVDQIQAIGHSSQPALKVARVKGESQLNGASAPPGIEDAKIK
jgi:hypothetical protein